MTVKLCYIKSSEQKQQLPATSSQYYRLYLKNINITNCDNSLKSNLQSVV